MIDHHLPDTVLVVGSGAAGLSLVLNVAPLVKRVVLMSKGELTGSNSRYAQGGIAAAMGADDDPELHLADTLQTGVGLCDEKAVRELVQTGRAAIEDLMRWGVAFDRDPDQQVALTLEAAHSRRRVLHAQGDATGREIELTLADQVRALPNVEIKEGTFAVELATHLGTCLGVIALEAGGYVRYLAPVTVLATGGLGHVYSHTTNPDIATGDGVAMAYRAGVTVTDLEFIQFHPTALFLTGAPRFLISEAVRGEGGILRNDQGEAFMTRYHPHAELAPRDVVSRSIVSEAGPGGHVWMDLRHLGAERVKERFPNIFAFLQQHGLDLGRDLIPVAPAAHYAIGGVKADLDGQTDLRGLWVAGEVACTGVHGANRLASNSLLECIVMGRLAPAKMKAYLENAWIPEAPALPEWDELPGRGDEDLVRSRLQALMWEYVGVRRNETGLLTAKKALRELRGMLGQPRATRAWWETHNLLGLAERIVEAAIARKESRGTHFREDFPDLNPQFAKHTLWSDRVALC